MAKVIVSSNPIALQFGLWTVIGIAEPDANVKTVLLCRCRCGTERPVYQNDLRRGKSNNCGCIRKEKTAAMKLSHGKCNTEEYRIWAAAKTRATNPNIEGAHNYSSRGITMCQRWLDSFEAFFEDMGPRPSPKHSIERMDNEKGYEPGNCKWATAKEQGNNRRGNHLIEIDGVVKTLTQWSESTGIKAITIRQRLKLGWCEKDAILTPPKRSKK